MKHTCFLVKTNCRNFWWLLVCSWFRSCYLVNHFHDLKKIYRNTLDANLPYKCHQKSIFGISCISLMITYEYSTCDWSMIYQKWIFDDICMEGLQVEFFHCAHILFYKGRDQILTSLRFLPSLKNVP